MSEYHAKPYLYDQPNDVIATYEGEARRRLTNTIQHATNAIGWNDEQTQTVLDNALTALIQDIANEIWLSEITYE